MTAWLFARIAFYQLFVPIYPTALPVPLLPHKPPSTHPSVLLWLYLASRTVSLPSHGPRDNGRAAGRAREEGEPGSGSRAGGPGSMSHSSQG